MLCHVMHVMPIMVGSEKESKLRWNHYLSLDLF